MAPTDADGYWPEPSVPTAATGQSDSDDEDASSKDDAAFQRFLLRLLPVVCLSLGRTFARWGTPS